MLKIGSLDSLTLLPLYVYTSSFLLLKTKRRANIASPYHSRVLFHLLIILSAVLKNTRILCQDEVSAEKDVRPCEKASFLSVMMYLWKASLFEATTDMGKCIVAIVEDLLAPKIINTLVPLLFALWAVSDPAINSGSAVKVIFLQKRLSLPLILRRLQVVPL
nr:hypothetical protein CFP56_47443 [Quercus suber]POE88891.1 hypothetical protein CFP56_47444 [Quercus suber]